MVDLMITNEKLQVRAENNIMMTTGVDRNEAKKILLKAGGSVKLGIMMTLGKLDKEEAIRRLKENGGHIRKALGL